MATSFQQRRLKITLQLAAGAKNKEGEPDTFEFTDFRTNVEISQPGGFNFAQCRLRIYGIAKEIMDRFTVINYQNLSFMRNVLTVEATDSDGRFCVVFKGEMFSATPDYSGAPQVAFVAEAQSGLIGMLAPAVAVSFPGARRVSEIMGAIAKELGVFLENNGVDSVLTDQTLGGTSLEKARTVQEAADIEMWYVPAEGVLAIAPKGMPRKSDPVTYSQSTGLVGWPVKIYEGTEFTALFNPSTRHGCKIKMESEVPSCNGEWRVLTMHHSLSAFEQGGPWFTHFIAAPVNLFVVSR